MIRILKSLLKLALVLFLLVNIIVAFHAYKFTHFYETGTTGIKTNAKKSSWDKTKEILFGINAEKKKNDAIPNASTIPVYLTTKDSIKLEGWYMPADKAIGTVILFHGHGSNKSGVVHEARAFNKMGYNSFLLDFRAHGNSEGGTCTIGFDESEDVKLAFEYITNKGENKIILWGISMGAATITKAIKDYQLNPAKVILEMPFGTIEDAVAGRVKLMGLPPQPIATLLTFWGGTEHGFWAFGMKPQEYASAIQCPVLLQWGKNDPRVSISEEEILFNHLPNANKQFIIYETAAHESLCKKENDKWNSVVSAFLK